MSFIPWIASLSLAMTTLVSLTDILLYHGERAFD